MADAFDSAWGVVKRGRERLPSNIMMRRLDPVKLQELAQRHHDSILQEIEDGTYEHETMIHPLWPYGFDKERYEKYVKEGGLTGGGYVDGEHGKEWIDDGIPHTQLPVPEKHDEGYTIPRVSWGGQWTVQYPNGEWHLVNNEGVGGRLFKGKPRYLDVHLSDYNNEGKETSSNMLPMKGIEIGVEDIAGLLGTEEKPLEEVIRSFGDRLEQNYTTHRHQLWEGGLGEQSQDPIEDAQEDRDYAPGTLDEDKYASVDVFNDVWEVAKSGDFFLGGPDKKGRMDWKGLRRAVKSGHKWANDPDLKIQGKQAGERTTIESGGGSEFSTFVRPPRKSKLWDPSVPWSGNENPKHRPWRAINLTEYGRRMPKNRQSGRPEIRSERQELDMIEDMHDRDTHEAAHEALELPLRGMPDSAHEYGAIAAQTSGHPRERGLRGLLGLPARDTRRKRFRSALGTHPVMQRRRRR
jgi:hypothetical protein